MPGKTPQITVTPPSSTTPPSLTLPTDECMTQSQSDAANAQAGLTACQGNAKNSPADCQKQYNDQINMILASYKTCHEAALAAADTAAAAAACKACQDNMCQTTDATDTSSDCKKSCDSECGSSGT